jgi:hypothetical protein
VRRFPLRTLLLMAVALVAFVRLYFITHSSGRQAERPTPAPASTPASDQACRTLERALEGAVRAPENPAALARARQQLGACPELPVRACELGPALDARAQLEAGAAPLRELLEALCQRCPAGANPCASHVTRAVMGRGTGRPADPANLRWYLEHSGPGTPDACAEVVRSLLVPAALSQDTLTDIQKETLGQLAPACARASQLPTNVLHAAVVRGGVPALTQLVQEKALGQSAALKPDRTVGAQGAEKAVDGQESTGVALTATPQAPRWDKDGALSAVFEPPVRQLSALRVRASGPGTLHAAVRTHDGLGKNDPTTKTSFVDPVACRFKGTGQWETCALATPLLGVEALSVFPDKDKLTLNEVEARGTR